jgi:hypothetical protein
MSNQIVLVNMVDTDSALFLNGKLVYSFCVNDGEYGELEDQIVGTLQEKLQADLVVVDLEKYDGWDWDNVAQKLKAQGIMKYIGAWELYKLRQIGIEYKPSRFSARVAQPNTEATDKLPQISHLVDFELAGVAVVVEILAKNPLDAIEQVKRFFSV